MWKTVLKLVIEALLLFLKSIRISKQKLHFQNNTTYVYKSFDR